jgi:hypothetical protein
MSSRAYKNFMTQLSFSLTYPSHACLYLFYLYLYPFYPYYFLSYCFVPDFELLVVVLPVALPLVVLLLMVLLPVVLPLAVLVVQRQDSLQ